MATSAYRVLRCRAALCLAVASLEVTAAAQSPVQPLMARRDDHATWRTASPVVRTYLEDDGTSVPSHPAPPPNVVIPASYRQTVDWMLRSSPTFRRQCSRIARTTGLSVVIERSLLPNTAGDGAVTRISRRSDGRLDANVEVGYLGDPVLLIAHEFEHVLEQVDGVDLPSMAARPATGVHAISRSGQFETDRAIAAGRQVAQEVYRSGRKQGP
jgi:hypothetical protein